MIRTQPHSPSITKSDFNQRSATLLNKIEGLHLNIENNKMHKFRNFLNDISNIENTVDGEIAENRKLYDGLINTLKKMDQDLEEQKHTSEKVQMQIQNRIQGFVKNNQKIFEKLQNQRVSSQQKLNSYLDQAIANLIKKSSSYKTPEIPLQQYRAELKELQQQINSFYRKAQQQQQNAKAEVFKVLQQCSNFLKEDQIQRSEMEALDYMKLIHKEITCRVNKMAEDRQRMQENVVNLLEKVYQVTASGATSTLI